MDHLDLIEQKVRQRAKIFYHANNGIPLTKLQDRQGQIIKCSCGNTRFKLYIKFGGKVYGKYKKLIKDNPTVFNFVCNCGKRQILKEEMFKYVGIKYGCSAKKGGCPKKLEKMNKDCLKCKFCYEKESM
jgi:hypothetical protein